MSEPFLGEIRPFPYNFAPRGWAFCQGQLLAISQNTALFSLIGTYYGGNGTTNFALPDLMGRAPIGVGQGPGLSNYVLGEVGGTTTVTLNGTHMPAHTHLPSISSSGTDRNPFDIPLNAGHRWAPSSHDQYSSLGPNTTMAAGLIGAVGGNQAHNNESPYLAINFCIALQGIYPPRN